MSWFARWREKREAKRCLEAAGCAQIAGYTEGCRNALLRYNEHARRLGWTQYEIRVRKDA